MAGGSSSPTLALNQAGLAAPGSTYTLTCSGGSCKEKSLKAKGGGTIQLEQLIGASHRSAPAST